MANRVRVYTIIEAGYLTDMHKPLLQPVAAGPPAPLAGLAVTVVVLVALPAVSWGLRTLQPAPAPNAALPPSPRAPWSSAPADTLSSWRPVFPGADQEQRFAYTNTSGNAMEVFRVAYRTQRQGAKRSAWGPA